MYQHDGEEWLYVLSGTLRLALADETHLLHPGDAAHFDARVPHRLAADGGHDAELSWSPAPPPGRCWTATCRRCPPLTSSLQ